MNEDRETVEEFGKENIVLNEVFYTEEKDYNQNNISLEVESANQLDTDNKILFNNTFMLPQNKFLCTEKIIEIISKNADDFVHDVIPNGKKENIYFLLNNNRNTTNRLKNKKGLYEDDCGVWDSTKCPTTKTCYIKNVDGLLKSVKQRNGKFVKEQKKRWRALFYPL